MHLQSKTFRWLALPGALILGFCLGRFSIPDRPQPAAASRAVPAIGLERVMRSDPAAATITANPPHSPTLTAREEEDRWRELLARPGSRGREQEMIAAIEELAARDPARALSLAAAESNRRLRLELYRATLRGWGKMSPDAAADWALSEQTALEANDAISAVLTGAVKNPDAALQLTARLLQQDPGRSREHGVALIAALSGAGEFEKAARFAVTGNTDNQEDWLTTAYSMWADHQPATALASLSALADPQSRRSAFNAAITSWAGNDAPAVVEYAGGLSPGDEKKFTLTVALQNWAANDPVAAARWIQQSDPSPELDAGAASVATDFQNFPHPSAAIEWAESVTDPDLRSSTLVTVIREWANRDSLAARNYVNSTRYLRPADRSELLADFGAAGTP